MTESGDEATSQRRRCLTYTVSPRDVHRDHSHMSKATHRPFPVPLPPRCGESQSPDLLIPRPPGLPACHPFSDLMVRRPRSALVDDHSRSIWQLIRESAMDLILSMPRVVEYLEETPRQNLIGESEAKPSHAKSTHRLPGASETDVIYSRGIFLAIRRVSGDVQRERRD
jgi:hypothetical protein